MLDGILIGTALVLLTVVVHYVTLTVLHRHFFQPDRGSHLLFLLVIFSVFAAHTLEIFLYASGYWLLVSRGHLFSDIFAAPLTSNFVDCLYFSSLSYTSLGVGDMYPQGALRLLTGIEATNGLLLITWSATFSYFTMRYFWRIPNANKTDEAIKAS